LIVLISIPRPSIRYVVASPFILMPSCISYRIRHFGVGPYSLRPSRLLHFPLSPQTIPLFHVVCDQVNHNARPFIIFSFDKLSLLAPLWQL
jgi:hypothetical protein